MMKRLLSIALALMLLIPSFAAIALDGGDIVLVDEGEAAGDGAIDLNDLDQLGPQYTPITSEEFGEFIVGTTTQLDGCFFTDMWGNNTGDIDVRSMLHGLSTVYWTTQTTFDISAVVVSAISAEMNARGNKVYTIELYDDLVYNDGTPITARDYVFSLLIQSAPEIVEIGGAVTNTSHIAGWDAFMSGQSNAFSGVRLLSDTAFSIEIKGENLPFFYELGLIEVIPYPIQVIAPGCEVADDGQGAYIRNIDQAVVEPIFTAALLNETILNPETGYQSHPTVTSGPWQLVSFDWETRELRAQINENFKGNWEGRKPVIDNIVFRSVLPTEMMTDLSEGNVHLLNKVVAGEDITAGLGLTVNGPFTMTNYPRLGLGFLSFSCEAGPMQFQSVRQAMAYAIDTQALVEDFNMSYGSPVYGYYGIGQWMVLMISGMRETEGLDEATIAAWDALNMDALKTYEVDLSEAERLLIDDGWTLNEQGQPYVKDVDAVRCKMVDGQLMALRLGFGQIQGSLAAALLVEQMREPLSEIGIQFEATELPFVDLLKHYYRQQPRTYDFMYLATNFTSMFDPYFTFNTGDAFQGYPNATGIQDEELEALALELRRTQPGAYLEYCEKWLAFQIAFNEKLPMLPLYGNIYFDFFTDKLQNYHPESGDYDWPTSLLYAELGEPIVTPDALDGATEGEDIQDLEGDTGEADADAIMIL